MSDERTQLSHETIEQMWLAELRKSASMREVHAASSPQGRFDLWQAFLRGVRASEAVMRSMGKGGA